MAEGQPEGIAEGVIEEGETPEGAIEGIIEEGETPEGEVPLTPEARETLESFPVIDTNNDSKLDNSELAGHYQGDIAAWLDSLDTNDDGALSVAELLRVAAARVIHSADTNGDLKLQLAELLRIIQLYNAGGYACAANAGASEDGFEAGNAVGGAPECSAHAADINADDIIALSELLRGIQLYNLDGYSYCETGSEDNYCGHTQHL